MDTDRSPRRCLQSVWPPVRGIVLTRSLMLVPSLALGVAAAALGQTPLTTLPLDSGAVVRIWLAEPAPVLGRLLERFDPGAPVVRFCRRPGLPCLDSTAVNRRAVPAADIIRLEVHRSRVSALTGAILGGLGGAVAGLAARGFAERFRDTDAPMGYGGVLWAAILGVVWGAFTGPEWNAWQPAP